jgi:peroxiredoxin Q/BCP
MLGPVVRKGDVVTDFELPDEAGAPRRLSGLLADGPVVLFFYPAAMSTAAGASIVSRVSGKQATVGSER